MNRVRTIWIRVEGIFGYADCVQQYPKFLVFRIGVFPIQSLISFFPLGTASTWNLGFVLGFRVRSFWYLGL